MRKRTGLSQSEIAPFFHFKLIDCLFFEIAKPIAKPSSDGISQPIPISDNGIAASVQEMKPSRPTASLIHCGKAFRKSTIANGKVNKVVIW